MTFWSYLLLGLATSLHCVGMCGSLVLTYSVKEAAEGRAGGTFLGRLAPHAAYQVAKIVSYMAVALVLGSVTAIVGTVLDLEGIRNWVMLFAGVFMVALGLSMTPWFPWLRHLTPRAPKALMRVLSSTRKKAVSDAAEGRVPMATPVVFGLLTGLMPCGPLIAAQVGAMGSPNALYGAMLMLAFGLGTAPLMLAFGVASAYAGGALRERVQYVAATAVVLFGLVIMNRGLTAVGSPVTFDSIRRAAVTSPAPGKTAWREVGGVAEAQVRIENTTFVPDTVSLPADRPARIVVDRREDDACSAQLAIPQLGVLADLKPFAKTTVEVPEAAAGQYTLTCGMGMMSGRLVVGQAASAAWPRAVALGGLAALAAVIGIAAWRRRASGVSDARRKKRARSPGTPRRVMAFTFVEWVLIAVAVALAVLVGLMLGGGRV